MLAVARDPVGRVALVVFLTGLAEIALGTTAIMTLFQTIGTIGAARRMATWVEALGATVLVVLGASFSMIAILWAGVWLVQRVVP